MSNRKEPRFAFSAPSMKAWFKNLPFAFVKFLAKGGWLLFAMFFLDLGTKLGMESYFGGAETGGPAISLLSYEGGKNILGFGLIYNTGMGYGLLEGQRILLSLVSGIVGIGLTVFLAYGFERKPWHLRYALYFMIAGDFGNFIDRAFYSQGVIDWIVVGNSDWPDIFNYICNIADISLSIGLVLLVFSLIYTTVKEDRSQKAGTTESPVSKTKAPAEKDSATEKELDELGSDLKSDDGKQGK